MKSRIIVSDAQHERLHRFLGRRELLVEVDGVATLVACREHGDEALRGSLDGLCDAARTVVGSGVAVQAGAQHGGLVALVGIGHGKGDGFLNDVFFIVIEVLVEVSCGNEHQVGIGCHTAKSLRREGACGNGCGVGAVVFTAHVGGQTGNELRRVEHRTGEGVVARLGVAHGELAALVAVVQIDTLDAAAALAVLEGRVLEVDACVDEADVHALA